MISKNTWFIEYQMLSNDEKELCKEYILDTNQKATVLDYERFSNAVGLMASNPNDLLVKYSDGINVAEEVALTFDNECVYIAPFLRNKQCINEHIYNMVMQINEQLELLSNEHNERNWTMQAMNTDKRWIKARVLANKLYGMLNCIK